MMTWRLAQYLPVSVEPNFLTRCGLAGNIAIFILSFLIQPSKVGDMGELAAHYLPSICCVLMSILQLTVCTLDNLDGLHARGTKQCSDLGALLDHYFDSITCPMQSVAMLMMLDGPPIACILAAACPTMIFHMQLLADYYLKTTPRVMGPEAQILCSFLMMCSSVMYWHRMYGLIDVINLVSMVLTAAVCLKYVLMFTPKFWSLPAARTQLMITWSVQILNSALYAGGWISTFEVTVMGVYISWDYSGRIVTHFVVKEHLERFNLYFYFILGVVLEYYFFNPLVWMFDSRNNIHLTTIAMWLYLGYLNWTHFQVMAGKLIQKAERRAKSERKMNHEM